MTLREKLFNAIWRCGFAPHEDPATVEKMKAEWPDDAARVEKLGDAALSAFRQWLADEGLVVVPGDVTDEMLMSGIESDAIQHPWEALDVWRRMIATAPDALKGD